MMPSIFGTKEVDRSPVFTEDDIRKLVLSFPPPEPRPGKECLVRSLSGRSLVRSDAVAKRFHSLLQSATGPIFLNGLHNELGVHDVQWLLTQEDERIYYSIDRRRLLPETTQKAIYQSLKNYLANRGLDLDKISTEKDVTTATLRRILAAQDADLSLQDLENGKTYDSRLLERLEMSIGKIVIDGKQGSVVLSDTFPQVPIAWLESTANNLIPHDEKGAQGLVDLVNGFLRYTPRSLLEQRQGEVKQAQNAYIQKAIEELDGSGYCEVTASSRPQILRKASDVDLARAIREAFVQKHVGSSVVELSTGKSTFLVTQDTFAARLSSIAAKAADAATEQWSSRRPGEEVTFNPTKLSISDNPEASLDQAILESGDPENKVQSTFEAKIVSLRESTTSTFTTTIQTDLLTPLKLYAQGADTITDTTLQPRVQDFIYDWARKDLAPETLRTVKDQNLTTTKAVSRDLDKFSDANVIWISLARRREGLYMSSGKDTSRMIKMVKEGDAEAGAKLEEWKDLIKQGKDTDDTKKEMRDAAANAVEELKTISPKAATDEAAAEQVTGEKTPRLLE
ncbi:unnamed protein product [Aureobasidium vineae]|uniref:Uncharacterized protein n=1 Tax=Aureobasidium vineae TaxID=2773715 RepID=A0A9N8JF92_9PEZI|nr:unnamed protein product [Aureobasidium vineae]